MELLLFFGLFASPAAAQLDPSCTVSILNRSAQVREDGLWQIDNVPANFGPVRARATCVRDGLTVSGQSEYFQIQADAVTGFPPIPLGAVDPIPASLSLTSTVARLTLAQPTAQLTATATFPGGSTADVTAAAGTTYTISNPAVASLSPDGLLTALASGTVLLSATNDGAVGLLQLDVQLSEDGDGDGLPDDFEVANGLDPGNPADALSDPDQDGLTVLDEFQRGLDPFDPDTDADGLLDGDEVNVYGTNPALFDTDGDGFSDGLEVQTGSDPLDPASFNLAAALATLEVSPTTVVLVVNTLLGEASRQLTVLGTLIDGTTLDLTPTSRGTQYASSDLAVCAFGAEPGRIFAGADGGCTVTVTAGGRSVDVAVTVRSFAPQPVGFVTIPGFANSVDVAGDYAFVAAGEAGLQVVDVSDRSAPTVVASLDTPGDARDVRVAGGRVYVADGFEGLVVVDVSDPLAPQRLGGLDTAGEAFDLSVRGSLVVIADGDAGLAVVDVADPAAPALLSTLPLPGLFVRGVDLSADGRLAVAVGSGGGGGGGGGDLILVSTKDLGPGDNLAVIDLAVPASPAVVGSTQVGDPQDVALRGSLAVVADLGFSFGMTTVDLSDPANPAVAASVEPDLGGLLVDVALSGSFAFGADVFFVNGVPIVEVSDPAAPSPRAILDFGAIADDDGSGVAVDARYVYLTTAFFNSRLYIGQYLEIEDDLGVPPAVAITAPAAGTTVIEGSPVSLAATATDDVGVASVELLLDGIVVFTDTAAPYETVIEAPSGVSAFTVGARAIDFGGNVGTAAPVTVLVVPDPRTTAAGTVVDGQGAGVGGADLTATGGVTGTSEGDGSFALPGVPTARGPISVEATKVIGGVEMVGRSAAVPPVPAGTTDVGTIELAPAEGCVTGVLTLGDGRCFEAFPTIKATIGQTLFFPVELLVQDDDGQFVPVGEVTPDPADGSFCATLRRDKVYLFRRRDIFCCGQVSTCQTMTALTDPGAHGACGSPGAACQDVGEVALECSFDTLFCGS